MNLLVVPTSFLVALGIAAACSPSSSTATGSMVSSMAGATPTGTAGSTGATTGASGSAGTSSGAAGMPTATGQAGAMPIAGGSGTSTAGMGAGGTPVTPQGGTGGSGTAGMNGTAGMSTGGTMTGGMGAGGSGTAGGGAITPVEPVAAGSAYTFTMGTSTFTVNAMTGGRVTSFTLDGEEMIASQAVTGNETNWGSTFWTAPQYGDTGWDWPPLTQHDSDPYAAAVDGGVLTLTGSPATGTHDGISVNKVFSATSDGVVTIEYQIVNGSSAAIDIAHWEITRVATGGVSFYPTGPGAPADPGPLAVTQSGGVTWLDTTTTPGTGQKHIGDGAEGWIAHAQGDLLLIKTFPDVAAADFALQEGDAEFYSDTNYVEVENQGGITNIAAGMSASWTVKWVLRRLAAPATSGDAALADFVRANLP